MVLINHFSQNFIQIYGQRTIFCWFVRKQNAFYGQTAIFDHFVRNRHFSGRPFTDIMPIFSDLSVNNRECTKCRPKKKLFSKNSFFLLAIKQRIGMITVIRVSVAGKLKRTSVFQIHDLDHLQNRIAFFSFQIVDVFLRCFLC